MEEFDGVGGVAAQVGGVAVQTSCSSASASVAKSTIHEEGPRPSLPKGGCQGARPSKVVRDCPPPCLPKERQGPQTCRTALVISSVQRS